MSVCAHFSLHDYPLFFSFRIAVRTGNFMLDLKTLRPQAPIVCAAGRNRYQQLAAIDLLDMVRMSDSDVCPNELFTTTVGGNAHAMDEQQEYANLTLKKLAEKTNGLAIARLAPIAAQCDKAVAHAKSEFFPDESLETAATIRVTRKWRKSVEIARDVSRGNPAFMDEGR